jgi:hypothetical protein
MKHDIVTMYNTFMWNWLKFALCDNIIFIASCINDALANEIHRLTSKDRIALGT